MIYAAAIRATNCTQLAEAGTPCEPVTAATHAMIAGAALAVPILSMLPLYLCWLRRRCCKTPEPQSQPATEEIV